jgi:hypothetical protein
MPILPLPSPKGKEGNKRLPTATASFSPTYTPVVDRPTDDTTVTHKSHQKVFEDRSDKRTMLHLISIAGGLVVISMMIAGYYITAGRKPRAASSITVIKRCSSHHFYRI